MASKSDIVAAFKLFDTDKSGSLSAEEFLAILTRPGENALTIEDAQKIIDEFDENKDGELSIKEFVKAWSKLCGHVLENEAYTNDMYDRRVAPYKDRIKALFDKLDDDKSGELTQEEMKEVITCYQGYMFDWDEFLGWYDSHGDGSTHAGNGAISIVEFGWYIADCAECDESKMEETIASFEEVVDYVINHKQEKHD